MLPFSVVVASESNRGIGKNGTIPWKIKHDINFFKRLTMMTDDKNKMNVVIMGRLTWNSLPLSYKPLPSRINIILSKNHKTRQYLRTNLNLLDSKSTEKDITTIENHNIYNNKRRKVKIEDDNFSELHQPRNKKEIYIFSSLNNSLIWLSSKYNINNDMSNIGIGTIFVIGGGQVYHDAFQMKNCHNIYHTNVLSPQYNNCDVYLPHIPERFQQTWCSKVITEEDYLFQYTLLEDRSCDYNNETNIAFNIGSIREKSNENMYINHEEIQYLNLVREILNKGVKKNDRTGIGTLSVFGRILKFSLCDHFPLLTTKRVFWRGVVEELLWFVSGSTDSNILSQKGVKIWDKNGSKEYLESIGLGYREEGDLGPIYSHQWRYFGATYKDHHTNYYGKGVDQLKNIIEQIKNNPNSRRILMSSWNPCDLKLMALPPCHVLCQFYVANGGLSCLIYQRSCDLGLGLPFNIASYALLTYMIAHICNLYPSQLIHVLGDCHIYLNHINPLLNQLERTPFPFPQLEIITKNENRSIDDFIFQDFSLKNYNSHPSIKMEMAI